MVGLSTLTNGGTNVVTGYAPMPNRIRSTHLLLFAAPEGSVIVCSTLSTSVRQSPSTIRRREDMLSAEIPLFARRVWSFDDERTRTEMYCCGCPAGGGGVLKRRTRVDRRQPPVEPKRATEGVYGIGED